MLTYASARFYSYENSLKSARGFSVLIGTILILVYTQGLIERVGVPESIVKGITELPIYLALLYWVIHKSTRHRVPGTIPIILYVMWTVVSALYHSETASVTIRYCRYVVYAYIVFAAVWCTPLTRVSVSRINVVILVLFLLQVIAAAFEVFFLDERVEAHVGTMSAGGGVLATIFPLSAMALVMSLYFYYRPNPLLLVVSCSFFLIGYASSKRAIYFMGPLLYFSMLLWYAFRNRTRGSLKYVLTGAIFFIILIPVLMFGISHTHRISQSHSKGYLDQAFYAVDQAVGYTFGEGEAGSTNGRTGTSLRVLSILFEGDWENILFGWGPSAVMGRAGRFDPLRINYGITGWSRDVISIGYPGMVFYVLFFIRVYFVYVRSRNELKGEYWLSVILFLDVSFFIFIFCHLFYGISFAVGGGLSYFYLYFLALAMSPEHEHLRGFNTPSFGLM